MTFRNRAWKRGAPHPYPIRQALWDYQLEEARQLPGHCLRRLGLAVDAVWAVTIDCFFFHTRDGSALFTAPVLDPVRDRYCFSLPIPPEELTGMEIHLTCYQGPRRKRRAAALSFPLWELSFARVSPRLLRFTLAPGDTGCSVAAPLPLREGWESTVCSADGGAHCFAFSSSPG